MLLAAHAGFDNVAIMIDPLHPLLYFEVQTAITLLGPLHNLVYTIEARPYRCCTRMIFYCLGFTRPATGCALFSLFGVSGGYHEHTLGPPIIFLSQRRPLLAPSTAVKVSGKGMPLLNLFRTLQSQTPQFLFEINPP